MKTNVKGGTFTKEYTRIEKRTYRFEPTLGGYIIRQYIELGSKFDSYQIGISLEDWDEFYNLVNLINEEVANRRGGQLYGSDNSD